MLIDFKVHNRRGQILVGDVTVPEPCHGLFFVQHGLSGSRQQPYITAIRNELVTQEYAVCTFDCAHSWGASDGDLYDATLTKHHGDLCAIIDWARNQPWYLEPFGLIGHSLGAASMILYAAQHAGAVLALAPISAVTGYTHWAEACQRYAPDEWHTWHNLGFIEKHDPSLGKKGRISRSFLDDLQRHDLLGCAKAIRAPVLMVVGDKDRRTLPEHQQVFFDKLPESIRKESALHIIRGASHTLASPSELETLRHDLREWISSAEK